MPMSSKDRSWMYKSPVGKIWNKEFSEFEKLKRGFVIRDKKVPMKYIFLRDFALRFYAICAILLSSECAF
jgi:hypothetical protein